jgi:hypothetical protein
MYYKHKILRKLFKTTTAIKILILWEIEFKPKHFNKHILIKLNYNLL